MTGAVTLKAIDTVSKFTNQLSQLYGITRDEVKHFFDNGVGNYLSVQYQKFSYTKTFLYRDTPVEFYRTFFPLSISNSDRTISTENPSTFLGNNQFIGILGVAGSGKTMLMKHIFLKSFSETFKIPLVIELRNLNTYEGSFINYLTQVILEKKLALNDKILNRLLTKSCFIFLIDGYDELFTNKKQTLTEEIDRFIDSYNENNFVVSSRPGAHVESLPRFSFYIVEPLSENEINQFIDLQIQYFEDTQLMIKIKQIIKEPKNFDFKKFVTNPLLLSMYILTYSDHPEIPKQKSNFYYNVYDTLVTKHDSITKKGAYQHEKISGLQRDEIFNFLKFFSLQSLFDGKYIFDDHYYHTLTEKVKDNLKLKFDNDKLLADLLVSINLFIRDGSLITYPHKSLQEYLAAKCISSQSVDFKKKVYEDKLKKYTQKSVGGGISNFWDLLLELDKEAFVKDFLHPNINDFFNRIGFVDTVDPILLAMNYIKYTHLKHGITYNYDDGKVGYSDEATIYSMTDLDIVSYLTSNLHKFIPLGIEDIDNNQLLLKRLFEQNNFPPSDYVNSEDYILDYDAFSDGELIEFLKNSSVPERLFSILKTIKTILQKLSDEISEENESKISFLD